MMPSTQRKVIRVHRQAMGMFAVVRRHLERFPQDGVLFIIDFERTLQDLGFDLSHGMRQHLLQRLYPPVPDGGELYEAVKEGRFTLPAQIRLNLGPPTTEGELTGVDPNGPGAPISRIPPSPIATRQTSAVATTSTAAAVPPKPGTGGYSVLVQLDDDIVNRVISVAYDEKIIPHDWSDTYNTTIAPLRLKIDADYTVKLKKPTLDFNTIFVNGVALNVAADAKVKLTFTYLPLGPFPGFTDTLIADISVCARAIGTAEIRNSGPDKASVYLNLIDLRDLEVTISGAALPPLVKEMIRAIIERVAQSKLGEFVLPLSFDFENARRAGVDIKAVASRIRQPGGGNPGTLSIAIDTTGTGDASTIPHIIPAGNHFGFVTTKTFLVGQAWPIIRDKEFPREEEGVQIHDPELDLRDHFIHFFVKATKEIDCLPDVDAEATVNLVFESFQKDGVYRTRLKSIFEDISLDFWDRLFYTILFGLLLGGIGGIGVGVIGMIMFNVVIAVLEGKGETALGNAIQESSVGFRNKIPGTKIIAEASTPIAPTVYSDMIFGFGDAVLYQEP